MTEDRTLHQSQDDLEASQRKSESRDGPPAMVPGYELEYRLGRGSYGEVWLAVDGNTRRRVAIKFYNRTSGVDVSMLSREVEKLARLAADRYVVQLLEVGWNATPPYYVMDYIEGGSLEDLLGEGKLVDQAHAIEIFHDVVMGLKHLHNKGILHCDLKPGNVLLDTDHKPRLADFGQSRLDSEQAPSLGTLFYMAPEQANLNAIPDVRWDIYSAGILLYCMLNGQPPHRDEASVKSIQQIDGVEQRLEAYRRQVTQLDIDKKIKGLTHVDAELRDILAKCLAKQPQKRFQSAQDVLWKLKEREAKHTKRPLLILGVVSPLLILLVMFSFFGYVYQQIIADTDRATIEIAGESNQWAAKQAASSASHRIDSYFDAVTDLSNTTQLQDLFEKLYEDEDYENHKIELGNPRNNDNAALNGHRQKLKDKKYLKDLKKSFTEQIKKKYPKASTWFITDSLGTMFVSSLEGQRWDNIFGKNFGYRTYFSGLPKDLDYQNEEEFQRINVDPKSRPRIDSPHISAIFRSTATGQWKIAFTCPFYLKDEKTKKTFFGGVIAVTVDTGSFVEFQNKPEQYAMLVDGRPGDQYGTILEHPYFAHAVTEKTPLPDQIFKKRVAPKNLSQDYGLFVDPIGTQAIKPFDEKRSAFSGNWIAGLAKVRSRFGTKETKKPLDTGLIVLAAKNRQVILKPVHRLSSLLLYLASIATVALLAVFSAIAWFAFRTIKRSGGRFLRYDLPTVDPDSTQR